MRAEMLLAALHRFGGDASSRALAGYLSRGGERRFWSADIVEAIARRLGLTVEDGRIRMPGCDSAEAITKEMK